MSDTNEYPEVVLDDDLPDGFDPDALDGDDESKAAAIDALDSEGGDA